MVSESKPNQRPSRRPTAMAPLPAPLPPHLRNNLTTRFSPRQLAYILRVLSPDELAVIADPADALIIARIKRMPNDRLERFDEWVPATRQHERLYRSLQLQWLRDEEYLLGTRLGRRPTERELFIDFMNNHNGLRFRAYFALKFPSHVRHNRPTEAVAAC